MELLELRKYIVVGVSGADNSNVPNCHGEFGFNEHNAGGENEGVLTNSLPSG